MATPVRFCTGCMRFETDDPVKFLTEGIEIYLCDECKKAGIPPAFDEKTMRLYQIIQAMTGVSDEEEMQYDTLCSSINFLTACILRLGQRLLHLYGLTVEKGE